MNALRNHRPRPQRRRPSPGKSEGPRPNPSNAHRAYERYLALAREASLCGDVVEAENCYQHAEHYFRVMNNRG